MRSRQPTILVLLGIGLWACCLACAGEDKAASAPLKGSLSPTDFASALIGRWVGVFSMSNCSNVLSVEFRKDATVTAVIEKNGEKEEVSGHYRIESEGKPQPQVMGRARITIESIGKQSVVFSGVCFNSHNAFPVSEGPFLRIYGDPHGVLKRAQSEEK